MIQICFAMGMKTKLKQQSFLSLFSAMTQLARHLRSSHFLPGPTQCKRPAGFPAARQDVILRSTHPAPALQQLLQPRQGYKSLSLQGIGESQECITA